MGIDKKDYPHLFQERVWPFGPTRAVFEDVAARHIIAVAASLPLEVAEAVQERGRARDLWTTIEELLTELGG